MSAPERVAELIPIAAPDPQPVLSDAGMPAPPLYADVPVVVKASDATWEAAGRGPAPLAVDVYRTADLSPWGLPLRGARPLARVVPGELRRQQEVEVVLPSELTTESLVAWVDFNQNGRLDVGDHVSGAAMPLGVTQLVVEHIWVTRLGTHPPVPTELTFALPAGRPAAHGRIVLLGWESMGPGGTIPNAPPALRWKSESRRREWPEGMVLTVTGLSELHVLPVFDLTGDDEPGPGDLVAPLLVPGGWSSGDTVTFAFPFGGGPR